MPDQGQPERGEDFRRRLCHTLVRDLLRDLEVHLLEVKSARFLADQPWPPGKRLRPIVFLLAYMSVSAERRVVHSADGRESRLAAAIELLHEASLVHDDVVDRSSVRRGQPSVHAENGDAMAILMGDYMIFRGLKLILDAAESWHDVALARELADTGLRVAHGEIDQLHRWVRRDRMGDRLSLNDYIDVISHKTAAFFAGCAEAGAALGGASAGLRRSYRAFGTSLGIAFQMVDDVIDVLGDPARAQKTLGNDLAEGTVTLPLVHAGSAFPRRAAVRRLREGKYVSERDAAVLHELMCSDEVRRRCAASVRSQADAARAALGAMPANTYRLGLSDLLDYVLGCSWGGLEGEFAGAGGAR